MKKYLFFASLAYSYSILRPLQDEIRRRGGEVAWYMEPACEDWLTEDEIRLHTVQEVMDYNPIAVFAPGNHIYDFFPGVKVKVFHGYAIDKRNEKVDEQFNMRGWFDIYCSQGPSSTSEFRKLEEKYGSFKVYETGWCKVDPFFKDSIPSPENERPLILYASTFTKGITSVYDLYDTVAHLVATKPWDWIITFHPKMTDQDLIGRYKNLADKHDNVTYLPYNDGLNTYRKIDAMLCDTSSIIIEVQLLDKPVVTYRNMHPGSHLIDVQSPEDIGPALEKALTRPKELMDAIHDYTMYHEAHRDGLNSARVLDAVDDFILNYKGRLKKNRPGLVRKWKIRKMTGYYPCIEKFKRKKGK